MDEEARFAAQLDLLELAKRAQCPAAINAARLILRRSIEGAKEYGYSSIIDRPGVTVNTLREDMAEEAADLLIYSEAERILDGNAFKRSDKRRWWTRRAS